MPIIEEKNITDINRLREKFDNEQMSKITKKNNLDGFLNQMKSMPKPSGIILNYNVDEVKKMIEGTI